METRREVEGKLKFLQSNNDKLQPVELWCLNGKENLNGWVYESIDSHLAEFRDIPILVAYEMGGARIGGGHNMTTRRDPTTGEQYESFTDADAERIVGWISKDDEVTIKQDENGIDWVVCKGNLWGFYCFELVRTLKEQGLEGMSISIETLVYSEDIVDGVAYEKDYTVLGVTILGPGVQPAVESANIRTLSHLSEIRSCMKEEILKAASYIEDKNNVQEKENSLKEWEKLTYFAKKQCAELTKRFEGYTVLAAAQDEEVIHVALLSKNGDTAVYDMKSVDETIAPERIRACGGTVEFDCGGNNLEVSLDAVTEEMCAEGNEAAENCKNMQVELQKANDALATAMATITEMRNAENSRRVASAKECALNTLNAFNDASAFEIPASALDAINKDIESGMYTERVNASGNWIGDTEVIQRVKALCADEQTKVNKANAEKNKNTFVWDKLNGVAEDDDSVAGLLKRKGIE